MADVELYFYAENVNLTAPQQETIVNAIKTWGKRDLDPNPRHRNHWRIRLDNKAVIFEAWVNDDNLTVLSLRTRLANMFGVALAQVTGSVTTNTYGQLVSITYASQVRLRVGVFGGVAADYYTSQAKVKQFLIDNKATWDAGA
jgi:hypothetical protein